MILSTTHQTSRLCHAGVYILGDRIQITNASPDLHGYLAQLSGDFANQRLFGITDDIANYDRF